MNIMIKLSGEALSAKETVFNLPAANEYAAILAQSAARGNRLFVVIGGGNICRSKNWETGNAAVKEIVDYIGMFATIQNCLLLKQALLELGVQSKVVIPAHFALSQTFCHTEDVTDQDQIILLGGGIGQPGYSTDMSTITNALHFGCRKILFCKYGADGVKEDDPREKPDAALLPRLTYGEYMAHRLTAIDLPAIGKMVYAPHVPSYVFRMTPENLRAMLAGQEDRVEQYTLIAG